MSLIERLAERTKPFLCQNCWLRSSSAYSHPTLGPVCPICLRPMVPSKKRKKRAPRPQRGFASAARLRAVGDRDGWICWLCGQSVSRTPPSGHWGAGQTWTHRPSLDHVLRRRDGGTSEPDNLRLAHQSCNEYREGCNVEPFAVPLTERAAGESNSAQTGFRRPRAGHTGQPKSADLIAPSEAARERGVSRCPRCSADDPRDRRYMPREGGHYGEEREPCPDAFHGAEQQWLAAKAERLKQAADDYRPRRTRLF